MHKAAAQSTSQKQHGEMQARGMMQRRNGPGRQQSAQPYPPQVYPTQKGEQPGTQKQAEQRANDQMPSTPPTTPIYQEQPTAETSASGKKQSMSTLDRFGYTLEQFLQALVTVWDDDDHIARKLTDFQELAKDSELIKKKLIKRWHREFEPYYDACYSRDVACVLSADIPYLREFRIHEKFRDIHDDLESQENIWVYVNELNKYAALYCGTPEGLPPKLMQNIQETTLNLLEGFDKGKSLKDYDIMSVGMQVLKDASEDEQADLLTHFGEIMESVGGLEAMEHAKEQMGTTADMKTLFEVMKGFSSMSEDPTQRPTMEQLAQSMKQMGANDAECMEKVQQLMSTQGLDPAQLQGIAAAAPSRQGGKASANVQRDRYARGWQPNSSTM